MMAVCLRGAVYGAPLPSATMAATLVQGGFKFLEGPVWFADLGVLFFSDIDTQGGNDRGPPSLIRRLTPPNTIEDFIPSANSNGLAIAPDGQILAATHDTQSLSKFHPVTKARTNIDLRYLGKHFNSPNDLAVRSDGNVYFSDPHYQLGNRQSETGIEGVYRVSALGEVTLVDDKLQAPNGVTLSPDENTLYVSTGQATVVKYPVHADGSTGPVVLFANTPSPDGMTADCAGNLYVTNQVEATVDVYSPVGAKIGSITAVPSCTNVAFGGADRKTLYITAGPDQKASLYSVQLDIPGYPY
jgi:gluconolactonase